MSSFQLDTLRTHRILATATPDEKEGMKIRADRWQNHAKSHMNKHQIMARYSEDIRKLLNEIDELNGLLTAKEESIEMAEKRIRNLERRTDIFSKPRITDNRNTSSEC